jgi:DNA (cytosine-5)-methyltransferase 1
MATARDPYPVVDVFAGPGGLGEGFAELRGKSYSARFESVVSIERDEASHQTLLLRHFLRRFPYEQFPDDYYTYLRGDITRDELYRNHRDEYQQAKKRALKISLGPESHDEVKRLIHRRLKGEQRWALVGGPPCQAYSLVGRSRMMGDPDFEEDERHTLYLEYLKLIIDHQPPVFVMENVKGLLSATIKGKPAITRIVKDLTHPKSAVRDSSNGLAYKLYSLSEEELAEGEVDPRLFLIRAEDYGIPQARHRMFIVGIREDIKVRPRLLKTHKPPTVRQTIGGLPQIRSSLSQMVDTTENWRREIARIAELPIRRQLNGAVHAGAVATGISLASVLGDDSPVVSSSSKYLKGSIGRHDTLRRMYDPRLSVLTSHQSRKHMASDLRRYMFAAVFAEKVGRTPKLRDFPEALLPDHQNVQLARTGQMFNDRFRVQLPDQVATTITSHICKDGHYFIHYDPTQCRSLTVREAARLQTFPDNYKFEGNRTEQYHQVGNAVPPYLATQIAEVIAEVLDAMKVDR